MEEEHLRCSVNYLSKILTSTTIYVVTPPSYYGEMKILSSNKKKNDTPAFIIEFPVFRECSIPSLFFGTEQRT